MKLPVHLLLSSAPFRRGSSQPCQIFIIRRTPPEAACRARTSVSCDDATVMSERGDRFVGRIVLLRPPQPPPPRAVRSGRRAPVANTRRPRRPIAQRDCVSRSTPATCSSSTAEIVAVGVRGAVGVSEAGRDLCSLRHRRGSPSLLTVEPNTWIHGPAFRGVPFSESIAGAPASAGSAHVRASLAIDPAAEI